MTSFELENPGRQRFTLTVTLSLDDWMKVSKLMQTDQGIVGYPLYNCINDVVSQATRAFYPSAKATEAPP